MAVEVRLKVPATARKGEIVEIKTMALHVMESGGRKDETGRTIPRKIINRLTCTFNGRAVFTADIEPSISANPYFQFFAKVEESGTFRFSWTDDDGTVTTAERKVSVS